MYFWKKKNTIDTGAANRIENAANSDHGVCPNAPTILFRASDSVNPWLGSSEEDETK